MSKNTESDFETYIVPIYSPRQDQFAILYLVDDPKGFRDNPVSIVSLAPTHTHTHIHIYRDMILRARFLKYLSSLKGQTE